MIRVLKYVLGATGAVVLLLAFAVFILQVPMPWKARAEAKPGAAHRKLTPVELVEGKKYTVEVPEDVARALGIRHNGEDQVFQVGPPKQKRSLVLPGSTALDPARIMRIRARFAPAEVVSIGQVEEKDEETPSKESAKTVQRELRPGDELLPGTELGVFFSPDAGNKKNDLFEAIVQRRLDEVILDKAEKSSGVLPDIYLWTARRNVDTDRSAERRARNTLLTWGVDRGDIEAVAREAEQLDITEGRRKQLTESEWAGKHDRWARVVLKAPEFTAHFKLTEREFKSTEKDKDADKEVKLTENESLKVAGVPEGVLSKLEALKEKEFKSRDEFLKALGTALSPEELERYRKLVLRHANVDPAVVVERNVTKGEIVVDNTINLFTLAKVDQLLVYANCPEDDLKKLYELKKAGQMKWTVQTVGTDEEGAKGTITEIGWIIDPNQHTAVIKGFIKNPGGKIRAGQFANATVELLPPEDRVEIPVDAVVEDGRQSIVFVQNPKAKNQYTMRRVDVLDRFEKSVFVRSKDFEAKTDEEKKQAKEDDKQGLLPRKALEKDELVLQSGVMELKALVLEQEAARRTKEAKEAEKK